MYHWLKVVHCIKVEWTMVSLHTMRFVPKQVAFGACGMLDPPKCRVVLCFVRSHLGLVFSPSAFRLSAQWGIYSAVQPPILRPK